MDLLFTNCAISFTLIAVLLLSCRLTDATEVSLFEMATAPSDLKWLQFSLTHDTDAWMEETWRYPFESDDPSKYHNQRAYVSCNLEMVNPSNWLFTESVATKEAKRVYIELKFSTRDCQEHPDPKSCKETFGVFMKQSQQLISDDRITKTNFEQKRKEWAKIGVLSRESNITVKTLSVPVAANTKSIRFAFEEQGLCLSLLNIRIFYRVCEEFTESLVHFDRHVTGGEETDVVKLGGRCIPNASVRNPGVELGGLCLATGKGILTAGECDCNDGFAPIQDSTGTRCESCPANTYKTSGGSECEPCPSNSKSGEAAGYCSCLPKYFRADKEALSAGCTQPPSRPVHLKFSELSSSSVRLSWEEPASLGGRREIWYEVKCAGKAECSTMRTIPDAEKLYSRTVVISGLKPKADYTFMVYAMNKVSSKSTDSHHSVIDVQTKSEAEDVAPVSQLRVDTDQKDGVTIAWAPADVNNVNFEVYVSPALATRGDNEIRIANGTYATFIGLQHGVVYTFKVRVKDDHRWSEPLMYEPGRGQIRLAVDKSKATTVTDSTESAVMGSIGYALLLAITAILFVIAVALCMIIVQRKTRNRKQMSDLDVLDTYKQDSMTPDYHTASRQIPTQAGVHEQMRGGGKLNAPLIPFGSPLSQPPPYYGGPTSGKYKAYVDPTAYEDPNQALSEFAFDIDPNDVFITQVIGGGEFGDVCLGGLSRMSKAATKYPTGNTINRMFDNEQFETVAIKTLKAGSSQKAKAEFLVEASIMGQFSHPNVIRLIGVVTSQEPIMIVTEYMANGSLDQYMRIKDSRGEKLPWEKVTEMLYGVSSGMKYLTDMGYVHRDLAARNVLVDMELRCKIADFGLSRGIEGSIEPEYTTNGGKIPVRWTAPEAITHRKFTAASDVWSFGVVLWEVCSYGERPYWDWTNQKVISEIMIGYRLPPPMDCPIGLYRIAQWCWRMDRHERPTFAQLVATLHKYIMQPILTHSDPGELPRSTVSTANLNTYGSITNIPTPPTSAPPFPCLEDFLLSIGLHHCYNQLASANIHSVSDLARRSHLDLLACGLISQECTMIREGLQGRLPPTPPGTATLPHPAIRAVRVQHHPLGGATIRRDEGFFV